MSRKELTTAVPEPSQDGAVQVEVTLPVRSRRQESRKGGQRASVSDAGSRPQIPRITRLMALAIKFQAMVDRGEACDYADLARLGYVTRARLTQIMNLLLLAPDIQEQILFMDASQRVSRAATERELRSFAPVIEWEEQRRRLRDFARTPRPGGLS
jgi:hypothetical protein